VGGGLAGLTLGIGLRQRDVPVIVWEAGRYPRHRVCGEFISGAGLDVLRKLGLLEELFRAGARSAGTVSLFSARLISRPMRLPHPAVCLSRFLLNHLLAQHFCKMGGELRENKRWHRQQASEGIVLSNGRRVQSDLNGWRWIGLKAHARGVTLDADLEMHSCPTGYVGLCQIADEIVNVCGLFRTRSALPNLGRDWPELLRGKRESLLHRRLRNAFFDESSFCSVSGLSLHPQRAGDSPACRIGDALTMIPPVTGNGMSLAFESAELALGPLAAYSHGGLDWTEAQQQIARACDETFSRRLAWATRLHRILLRPWCGRALSWMTATSPRIFRVLFEKTR